MAELKPIYALEIPLSQGAGEGDALLGVRVVEGKLKWYRFNGVGWSKIGGAPTTMPTTHPLKIRGAENKDFDGRTEQTITIPTIPTIPSTLPTTHPLKIRGAENKDFDGSTEQTVNIPTIPSTLPNTYPLRVRGAAAATYTGAEPVDIYIPLAGSVPVPTGVALKYPTDVSIRNLALQRIVAQLLPAFVAQSAVLFQPAGGDAIELYPDGTFKVQHLGTSKIYIIPTLNSGAYKTVSITVRPALVRRTGSGAFRRAGNGSLRIF
jgi:hypothetical protein